MFIAECNNHWVITFKTRIIKSFVASSDCILIRKTGQIGWVLGSKVTESCNIIFVI